MLLPIGVGAIESTVTPRYTSPPIRSSRSSRGSAYRNATVTASVAITELAANGSQPPSGKSASKGNTTSSAGSASVSPASARRVTSTCVAPAKASSKPATGLVAAHTPVSAAASQGRSRTKASTASTANVTPSANVILPIHRSPAAASAKHTAPQRARGPYTASAIRSKANVETSTASAPTSRIPASNASHGNRRLYPGRWWPPYQLSSHSVNPEPSKSVAR